MAVSRKLALVTGASAGIGAAFARLYASKGFDIALAARRLDRLELIAGEIATTGKVDAIPIAADLSKSGAVDDILGALSAKGRSVDVLVNNAGYGLPGTWLTTSWQDQAAALQVMLTAPLELSHKVLPGMAARKWGRIVNIASLAGLAPGSRGYTTYGAVKAALIKFSQSLHVELTGSGVHCTAIAPGFTYSEFHDVSGTRDKVSKAPKFLWQTAERVAEIGYRASERNRAVAVTGAPNKMLAALAKLTPDDLALYLAKGLAKRYRNVD